MFKVFKKKAMMMGVSAGPFMVGLIIGLIVGAIILYMLYNNGTLTCPGIAVD